VSEDAELFEDAPCGFLVTRLDGTIVRVNRTFERLTGHGRADVVGARRFRDLLPPGGKIYHDTHVAPLLQMQGSVNEIAVEIVRADGTRLPALVNSVRVADAVRTAIFEAGDRRRYEQELLQARRREQEIAQALQRSLLSGRLPAAPGLEVAVVYRPAVSGLEVGGDWYDAFWIREDQTLAVVVGDVVGRGIEAAAAMGQLRSAVRALAATGLGPGRLLDALDAYARRHDVGRMTTVVYAEIDLRAGRLRYAAAGHPPPLLAPVGSEPAFLWEGRSMPVDAYLREPGPRGEAVAALGGAALLVLYSDGLVERRAWGVIDGMERLRAALPAGAEATTAAVARGLVDELHDPEDRDDVCLLAARLDVAATRG
jgi:phosphoserine phosphatase RsbU/P